MQAKRSLLCTYLRTAGDETNPTWSLIGDGFTTNSISYNPDSEDKQYINMDSATTILKKYKPTMKLEGVIEMDEVEDETDGEVNSKHYNLNAVYNYINNLRRSRNVSNESEILIVELYTGTLNVGANVYEGCSAQRQQVNIQIDEFGGDAGDTISFSSTVNFEGDPSDSITTYDIYNLSTRDILPLNEKFSVTYSLTNVIATTKPLHAYKSKALLVVLKAENGYNLPDTITVANDSSTLTVNTDYKYNKVTGKVEILKDKITGAVTITCTGASN